MHSMALQVHKQVTGMSVTNCWNNTSLHQLFNHIKRLVVVAVVVVQMVRLVQVGSHRWPWLQAAWCLRATACPMIGFCRTIRKSLNFQNFKDLRGMMMIMIMKIKTPQKSQTPLTPQTPKISRRGGRRQGLSL